MISEFVEYVKQVWKNKPNVSSPLNADRLNHMEAGIENNSKKIKETVTAVNELTEKMPKVYTTRSVIKANNKKTIEFPENYFSNSPVISVEAEVSGAPIYVEMNSTTKNSTVIVNSAGADLYFHLIAILS